MKLTPKNNQVLIELIEEHLKSQSGLVILMKPHDYIKCKVLKVSHEINNCEIAHGDTIFCHERSPQKVEIEDHVFHLIDYSLVLGVVC